MSDAPHEPTPVTIAATARDLVTIAGPDAATYLQGQLSQDLDGLDVGASSHTFVLSPQGKVDGWGRIVARSADEFAIDVDLGAGAVWEERLRRFLLRTKAEVELTEAVPTIQVRGADVEGGLGAVGLGVEGADFVGWEDPGPPPGVPEGAIVIDGDEAERLRICAGVPRWGAELDDGTIPATLGRWLIDASVSFTKGCYTGQELVARIDSRGGNVPRRLCGLVVEGPAPAPGSEVRVGGEAVGAVTSSAPAGEGSVALTFAPRSVELDDGPVAASVDGVTATLSELPVPAS